MLKSYPDYGKSPPEYLAGIVGVFSLLPTSVQNRMLDPIRGIRGRHPFLPTIADIVKMADEVGEEEHRRAELERKYGNVRRIEFQTSVKTYDPFPQLSSAFRDEPELLDRPFEVLDACCKTLMVEGKEAARAQLLKSKPFERRRK